MIKSETFANILYLLNIYIKDSLQGALHHSFLQNKKNRWLISISITIGYLLYFYFNVIEFAKLSKISENYSFNELKSVISISIGSYSNLSIIAGIFIFLLINSTVNLRSSSLFLSKVLPYSEKEVYLSIKLFKLGLASICFEIFFVILIPGLGVLKSPFIAICLFFSCHFLFWVSYLFVNWCYILVLAYLPFSEKHINGLISMLYFLFGLTYLFLLRFKVEFFLAKAIDNPIMLSLFILIGAAGALILLSFMDTIHYDLVFLRPKFIHFIPLNFLNKSLKWTQLAVVRTKFFLYAVLFVSFIGIYSLLMANLEIAANNLLDFWPFLGITFINYADSTISHRILYPHLRIQIKSEVINLLFTIFTIQFPTILLASYLQKTYLAFLHGIIISLVSLIIGFLFPRSTSSTNETVSFLLLLLTIPIVYLLMKVPLLLFPIIVTLILLLAYIVKKETEITL